jgi:uncharacterized OB-fold protein
VSLEVRRVDEWKKPLPEKDPVSGAFWSAAAEGRLLYQQCPSCGHRQFYPRALCTACGADPEWAEASGRGTVHTFTVVRQQGARAWRDEVPYVVAIIELEEGPRMMGNVTGCPVEEVTIGMPVRAYAVQADDGIGIPYWERA